jgi:hypothetical protein
MAPTEQTLNSVNYSISVYVGYLIIITGLIGSFINILVFTQLKLFRRNQSAFYLTVATFAECYELIFSTTTRVIATASGYDYTQTSLLWCRFRAYLVQVGTTALAATICCSAIDQYLSTSYHNQLRQISTFKLAQRLVGILIILTALYCVPFPIFEEIHPSLGCATYNPSFNYFYSFVHLCVVIGILPIVVSLLFSLLSYQNVRRIVRRQIPVVRRRLDRQLTAMILVRVALFIITTLPLISVRSYQINNLPDGTDTYALAVSTLLKTVVTTFYNFNYSVFDLFLFCTDFTSFVNLDEFLCLLGNVNSISSTSKIFICQKNLGKFADDYNA